MNIIDKFDNLIKNEINTPIEKNTIGVLSEKTLHKIIKNLYESNINNQEVKIGPYYVDILKENNIIEIQTKQFNKMRDKLNHLLSLDKYNINIVYPVFNSKMIYFIDEFNSLSNGKKSPKKLRIPEVFYELYKIKQILENKNLKITLLIFDIDEVRIKANNRKGFECFDRIPKKLINVIELYNKDDYIKLLPLNLNEEFSVKDLSLLYKCDVKYVNYMLNVMKYLDVVEVLRKDGKKYIYSIKKG